MDRKFSIFFCILFIFMELTAQDASILIKSIDTSRFYVRINSNLISESPLKSVKINGFNVQGKYTLEIENSTDTQRFNTQIFILDKGFCHFYIVDKKGITLKKIAPDIENIDLETQIIQLGVKPDEFVKNDTVLKDSSQVKAEEHYKLEGYTGKIGCSFPIKEEDFNGILVKIKSRNLENDKLQAAKELCENKCILTKQVSEILTTFEYEETKLDFAFFIYPELFDVDNFITTLKPNFKFENSIDQLKQQFQIKK
ncbi:MAG: DUF4476 domain-containing protein [Flavobacteriales bacterium]|nr:DUF4476 domain-containing protein [Flavobacteriales bacterium]